MARREPSWSGKWIDWRCGSMSYSQAGAATGKCGNTSRMRESWFCQVKTKAFRLRSWRRFALGRPVIATRVAAVPELVEHERSGWLIPPFDVDALADAIALALQTSSSRL